MASLRLYFKKNSQEPIPFKNILIGVALIHLFALSFFLFGPLAKAPQKKITLLQMLPMGNLVKGQPNASAIPSPASPAPQSIPRPPSPPSEKVAKKVSPSQPVKTSSSSLKVNLNEIKRSTPQTHSNLKPVSRPAPLPSSTPSSTANANAQMNADQIKNRLQTSVGKAGVMSATADGQSGAWNGANSSEAAAYFVLIRDVYYQAWQQPHADLTKKWTAILKIRVNKKGDILNAVLEQNSGYSPLDQSVQQVARLVKTIGTPLPDVLGNQFADISIVFEF